MAGNQSRGLIAASKTRGWDPTVIPGSPGTLENFDKDMGNLYGKPLGTLPDGVKDSYPDGYDVTIGEPQVTWNTPDAGRENKDRRTTGAPPGPGGE